MKIQDVIIESGQILDEYSIMNPAIRQMLLKQGYKFLGAGVDQSAYLEPGGQTVLKIFGTQGKNTKELSADQKMFVNWAAFCQKNSDNPFLPKFSGWEPFEFNDKTYLQIRTEFLEPSGSLGRAIALLGNVLSSGIADYYTLATDYITAEAYRQVSRAVGEQNVPLLLNTLLELIYKTQKKKSYNYDLHAGNIMLRPNGQPVLNDPFVL